MRREIGNLEGQIRTIRQSSTDELRAQDQRAAEREQRLTELLNTARQEIIQTQSQNLRLVEQRLAETQLDLTTYKQLQAELSSLGLTNEEHKQVTDALTVRKLAEDYSVVVMLLRAKVKPKELVNCFKFLLTRGNLPDDYKTILELVKGGIKSEHLDNCFKFMLTRGNLPDDFKTVLELVKGGV